MKRRLFAVICMIALLLFTAGCGGQADVSMVSPASSETAADTATATKAAAPDPGNASGGSGSEADAAGLQQEDEMSAKQQPGRPVLELGSMYIREANDENDVVYVSGSHDTLRLSEDSAGEYPELSAALDQYMHAQTNQVRKLISDYAQYYREDPQASEMAPSGYDITNKLYVRRADRQVLSILEYSYDYAGGAHGNFSYTALNLDARTGEEISLDDIITDREKLGRMLEEELLNKYDEASFFPEMRETIREKITDTGDKSLIWTLDPQGITFYFNPYEIAAYAEGSHTVTVLYSPDTGIFTEKYRPENGEGYVCGMPLYADFSIDADQDGEPDSISVSYSTEEETDSIRDLTVSVNNKHLSIDEIYCYHVEPSVVLTADGRVFLYAWCQGDNDFVNMYIFDLSLGSPVSMGSMALAQVYSYIEEENVDYGAYRQTVTDPSNMRLSTRFDLLSTYDVQKTYSVKESGPVPVSEDPYYEIVRDITLTSVKDITAELVDEAGNVSEKAKLIPAGSTFKLYRTDGQNTVDALLSDGKLVRLLVTGTYPQKVNGINAEELFEELYYAG